MANRKGSKHPYRSCDYCSTKERSTDTDVQRRAWTVYTHTRKLACPQCQPKGREEDGRAGVLLSRNRALLERRILAEPMPTWETQHAQIRSKYPDAVVLLRSGDFYHALGDDARLLGQHAGLPLGQLKNCPGPHVTQASFPFSALDMYLPRLVKAGYRVAICDEIQGASVPSMVCDALGVQNADRP